jgi:hypothetical protein
MLEEGTGAKGIQEQVKPVDVLELVAARLVSTRLSDNTAGTTGS